MSHDQPDNKNQDKVRLKYQKIWRCDSHHNSSTHASLWSTTVTVGYFNPSYGISQCFNKPLNYSNDTQFLWESSQDRNTDLLYSRCGDISHASPRLKQLLDEFKDGKERKRRQIQNLCLLYQKKLNGMFFFLKPRDCQQPLTVWCNTPDVCLIKG